MTTISRDQLIHAIDTADAGFVSREAKHRLLAWAYDAKGFTVAGWDGCPLDQVGLVKKFETRPNFSIEENTRFANEASELDARILPFLRGPGLYGEVSNLKVTVI